MNSKPILLTCLMLLSCGLGKAVTIYSNMGPNSDNYSDGVGHTIQVNASTYIAFAMGFRTGDTPYTFTELQVPLLNLTGTDNLTIRLRSDAGAGPGAVVETLSVDSPQFPDWPAPFNIASLLSTTLPLLSANSIYWITMEPTDLNRPCWYSWSHLLSIPELQILAGAYNPSSSTPVPWDYHYGFQNGSAFAVFGTPVPEPSTSALAWTGVLAFLGRGRLMKRLARPSPK